MKYATTAPTMYTSPCAKLISRSTPYTIVYPSAISAYVAPTDSPLISCWRNWCMGRDLRLAICDLQLNSIANRKSQIANQKRPLSWCNRFRQVRLSAADFQHFDRLASVVLLVDGDRPAGAGEIFGGGQRVADRPAIGVPRALDRVA